MQTSPCKRLHAGTLLCKRLSDGMFCGSAGSPGKQLALAASAFQKLLQVLRLRVDIQVTRTSAPPHTPFRFLTSFSCGPRSALGGVGGVSGSPLLFSIINLKGCKRRSPSSALLFGCQRQYFPPLRRSPASAAVEAGLRPDSAVVRRYSTEKTKSMCTQGLR